jgi:tRNA dimethylallyltransferase
VHPPDALAEWLRALAPARAAAIAANDPYRVLRALEIALVERAVSADDVATASRDQPGATGENFRTRGIAYRKIYLDVAGDELERRIAARVDAMLAHGLVDEAERIGGDAVAADAVGYREVLAFLAGFSTRDELRAHLIRNTRRYAKRQATWFRTEPGLVRAPADDALAFAVAQAGALPGWA